MAAADDISKVNSTDNKDNQLIEISKFKLYNFSINWGRHCCVQNFHELKQPDDIKLGYICTEYNSETIPLYNTLKYGDKSPVYYGRPILKNMVINSYNTRIVHLGDSQPRPLEQRVLWNHIRAIGKEYPLYDKDVIISYVRP